MVRVGESDAGGADFSSGCVRSFGFDFLSELSDRALSLPRQRINWNLHADFHDTCQRLFNAIGPESYIRPHRHLSTSGPETLIAIRGLFAFIGFSAEGLVEQIVLFGSEAHADGAKVAAAVEIPPNYWHTVVALTFGAAIFEVKRGPFRPSEAKDFAPWAPEEGSLDSERYLSLLREHVQCRIEKLL